MHVHSIYIVSIIIIMVAIHMQCSKATKCGDVESVQGMTLALSQLCEMALVLFCLLENSC